MALGETEDSSRVAPSTTESPEASKEHQPLSQKTSDSQEGEIGYYELKDENMELVELNTAHNITSIRPHGQHRELPVDVPDSFVG